MKNKLLLLIAFLTSINLLGQTKFQINDYPLHGNHRIVTRDSAEIIFESIQKSLIFEFKYTRGGCDYRAHAVYLMLKKMGVNTFKIWNFASGKIFLAGKDFNSHNLLLSVKDQLNLSTKGSYYSDCNIKIEDKVYWGYHVAPVILVQNDNKVDTLVIDPALYNTPVEYKIWIRSQLQEKASSYFTFLDGNLISFQTESQYQRNGSNCQDCSGNNIITGVFWTEEHSIQQKWIEQSLSKGKVFVEYYRNEIEPLEKDLLKYPSTTTDPKVKKIACELAAKKQKISDESGITELPKEYQDRYKQYIENATKILFD